MSILLRIISVVITPPGGLPDVPTGPNAISSIIYVVLAIFGAVAVLIITYAGFKYVMSRGNPEETAKAKDTILYAVAGLAVSILAYAIVAYVIQGVT